jgi:hypothetical protein
MGLELKRIYNECNAIMKSFRLLPKSFLLNIKTCKYLKERELLDKMEMVPF